MKQNQSYITSLTALRGIAAIWVMIFHIDVILFYREFGYIIPHESSGIISKGYLWVDFFFLLSGFIISHVYGEAYSSSLNKVSYLKSFLWARFTRIYPLHLFLILILVPYIYFMPKLAPAVVDGSWETFLAWSALTDNLLLITALNQHIYLSWNIVAWSISAEWWTYIAAGILLPFLFSANRINQIIATIVSAATLIGMVYIRGNLDITFDYGWLRCLAEFSLGAVVYQLYLKKWGKNWLGSSLTFLITTGLIAAVFHTRVNDLFVIPLFIVLLFSAAYNQGSVKNFLESKVMSYLGNISYSIYMVHGVMFIFYWYTLTYLKNELGITSLTWIEKYAFILSFVIVTLIFSHFTYNHIEIKARKQLRKLRLFETEKVT